MIAFDAEPKDEKPKKGQPVYVATIAFILCYTATLLTFDIFFTGIENYTTILGSLNAFPTALMIVFSLIVGICLNKVL